MKRITTLLFFILLISKGYAQNLTPVDEGSTVKFSIKNFGFSTVGSFTGLKGNIRFDVANMGNTNFNVSINATSINTDNQARDKHLRKEEYFDVDRYPLISFVSSTISANAKPGLFLMYGKLTIKGVTKEISFPFTVTEQNNGYLFSGAFKINRRDFKVGGSSLVLADNLEVSLSVFAKKN